MIVSNISCVFVGAVVVFVLFKTRAALGSGVETGHLMANQEGGGARNQWRLERILKHSSTAPRILEGYFCAK